MSARRSARSALLVAALAAVLLAGGPACSASRGNDATDRSTTTRGVRSDNQPFAPLGMLFKEHESTEIEPLDGSSVLQGLRFVKGNAIDRADDTGQMAYTFEEVKAGARRALWFVKIERRDAAGVEFKKLLGASESLEVRSLAAGEDFATGNCGQNDAADPLIAAIAKFDDGPVKAGTTRSLSVQRAWRADLANETLTEISRAGVYCTITGVPR